MGEFTEFYIAVDLTPDLPPDVICLLRYMLNELSYRDDPIEPILSISKHPLFKTARWAMMLRGGSAYYPGAFVREFGRCQTNKYYFLTVHSSFKNYNSEIEHFLDWLMPYIDANVGDFIGYYRTDRREMPVFLYKQESTQI